MLIIPGLVVGFLVLIIVTEYRLRQRYGSLVIDMTDGLPWHRDPIVRTRLVGMFTVVAGYTWAWFLVDAYFVFCFSMYGGSEEPCVANPTAREELLADIVGPLIFAAFCIGTVLSAGFRRIWIIPVLVLTTGVMLLIVVLYPLTLGAPLVWLYVPLWLKGRFRSLSPSRW